MSECEKGRWEREGQYSCNRRRMTIVCVVSRLESSRVKACRVVSKIIDMSKASQKRMKSRIVVPFSFLSDLKGEAESQSSHCARRTMSTRYLGPSSPALESTYPSHCLWTMLGVGGVFFSKADGVRTMGWNGMVGMHHAMSCHVKTFLFIFYFFFFFCGHAIGQLVSFPSLTSLSCLEIRQQRLVTSCTSIIYYLTSQII